MPHASFRHVVLAAIGVIALGSTAGAQSIVDPRYAEFSASTDHAAVVSGQVLVTGYTLQFFLPGAQQPFQSAPLGKPTPDASNLIRVDLGTTLTAFPTPGVVYEARVSADGPGGSSLSAVSNQFEFSDPCAPSLSATSATVSAAANTGSFMVTTATGCAWTASSNRSWLTITSGASRTGSGSVGYSVAANLTTSVRTGTITAAGRAFTVTQSAAACTYSVSPTSASVASSASSGSLSVTATTGCAWTASSNSTWITVTGGSNGSGNGAVSYSVAANSSASARSGSLTVAGRTFTISQAGACTFSVTPSSLSMESAGGTATFTVTTGSACAWTATSSASWITISAGQSRTGSGSVTATLASNSAGSSRSATVLIGGTAVPVTQQGMTSPLPPSNLRIIR